MPIIFDKLPAELRKNLVRLHKGRNLQLHELRQAIHEEINVMEAGQISSNSMLESPATMSMFTNSGSKHRTQHHEVRKLGNQQQLQRPSNLKVCTFCLSNTHYAINCNVKTDYESRIAVVKNKRLCYNCLGTHQVTLCKSQKNCKNCNQRHHTSICKRANYDTNQRQQATYSNAPELCTAKYSIASRS